MQSQIHHWDIFSLNGISVSATDEKNMHNMSRNSKTLYVTTSSLYKTHSSNETMKIWAQTFANRKKSDKDIWLLGQEVSVQDILQTTNM